MTTMTHTGRGAFDTPTSLGDRYQYEPLVAEDAVRVLNLEPANDFRSPLRGSITQHRLTVDSVDPDGCKYSAVSYTWGDPVLSNELFLRLDNKWTLLPITKNADLLLRHLRDTTKEIYLWIDGVCINQGDQKDKAHQIPLMGQIYAHAESVHVWLGAEEIEDAQRAFSLIRRMESDESWGSAPESDDLLCLERFFNRPWFFRRWVIQEIFFAHDAILHCGHHRLSLSRIMAVLRRHSDRNWGWGSQMLKSTSNLYSSSYRKPLLSLLRAVHESECADERDRIAAIYSMAAPDSRLPLHYEIKDWKKMYTEIASDYLRYNAKTAKKVLNHLCDFGSIEPNADDDVPSWVPNWSKKRKPRIPYVEVDGRFFEVEVPRGVFPTDRILRPKQWKEAQHWYFATSIHDSTKIELSRHRLRLNFDFFVFIRGCGIVDQVVRPALSRDFWQEVAGLFDGRGKGPGTLENRFQSNSAGYQSRKRHEMEMNSLKFLLVSILDERAEVKRDVMRLCDGLSSGHGYGTSLGMLENEEEHQVQQDIRSAMKAFALLRVQTTLGYYWAIGSQDIVKGDWLVPIIPHREGELLRSTEQTITPFMGLRSIVEEERGNTWYPSPTSSPKDRLRHLERSTLAENDSVHVTAKFVSAGESSIHAIGYGDLTHEALIWWNVFRRAAAAAEKRSLPGPIIFDIV